ncbi:MAG: hypothetical protein JF588_08080 [Caulobacterales bacterium]|nr:hypothetical protein [Caulobacterales bacterium]
MRRAIWILAGLAALTAASAAARPFYIVQSGPDAWTVMDPQGIERDGAVRKAWAVRVQRNILNGNPPQAGYVRTLTEYDCDQQRTRWREVFAFSRAGAQLAHTVNARPEWGPAAEDSDVEAAYRVICEGGGGGSVVAADSVAKVVIGLMGSWDALPAAPAAPALPAPGPGPKPAAAKGASSKDAAPKAASVKPASAKAVPAKAAPAKAAPAAKPAQPKA